MKSTVRYSIVMIIAAIGAVLFVLAFYYFPSNILMILTSLTLIIVAVSFAYTTSTRMVQARVVTSQMSSLTLTLNRLLKEAGYEGKTCFLPPQLPGEPPVQLIGSKPIIPTGLHLESIFEKETGVDFFSIDLKQLEELLLKVIVDKLEIASEMRISDKDGVIVIQMKGFAFYEFYDYLQQTTSQDSLSLSPTVSALACALAKATRKTIWVDQLFLRKQNLEIKFRYGSTDVGLEMPWLIKKALLNIKLQEDLTGNQSLGQKLFGWKELDFWNFFMRLLEFNDAIVSMLDMGFETIGLLLATTIFLEKYHSWIFIRLWKLNWSIPSKTIYQLTSKSGKHPPIKIELKFR